MADNKCLRVAKSTKKSKMIHIKNQKENCKKETLKGFNGCRIFFKKRVPSNILLDKIKSMVALRISVLASV